MGAGCVCMYVSLCVCMYVYACMYVCVYVRTYVCMCAFVRFLSCIYSYVYCMRVDAAYHTFGSGPLTTTTVVRLVTVTDTGSPKPHDT